MVIDITAGGIIVGFISAVLYLIIEIIKHKNINVYNSGTVFLAVLAITVGGELIFAAFQGDSNNLPSSWREYLSAAGIVGIGLSIQHLIRVIKKLFINRE